MVKNNKKGLPNKGSHSEVPWDRSSGPFLKSVGTSKIGEMVGNIYPLSPYLCNAKRFELRL